MSKSLQFKYRLICINIPHVINFFRSGVVMKRIALLTLLSLFSSMSFANADVKDLTPLLGDYVKESTVRRPSTKKQCHADFGEYDSGYCYFKEQNTVSLMQDELYVRVEISVLFGAANMRDFSGYVTGIEGNVVTIAELDSEAEDYIPAAMGCQIQATFENSAITDLHLNDSCDPELSRAVDTKRVK